jgi:hypothetical protein
MPKEAKQVQITAPKMEYAEFNLQGTAPFVQLRFSEKAKQTMRDNQMLGSRKRTRNVKAARDFEDDYKQAFYMSDEGWYGVNAAAFRNAMISACRLVGYAMTRAKLAVFIEADGMDAIEGVPLVRIYGEPEHFESLVRNATGVADIRVRALWRDWSLKLRVKYDADQFSLQDVTNLIHRVGEQVGIGEGRPDSKKSAGQGWGTFKIV